jgi:hypothetical protein
MTLPPFLAGRRWFVTLGGGQVYMRYSLQPRPGSYSKVLRCLDVADITLPEAERGQGTFTRLLDVLESACGHEYEALRMENVLNTRLAAFFGRRPGYVRVLHGSDPEGKCPCFIYVPDER